MSFKQKVCETVRDIPEGKVATYGQIAAYAGVPKGARGVAWILHSCSEKESLPWHRVVNRNGGISLRSGGGREIQEKLLRNEGIRFDAYGRIDLTLYGWGSES
jgi:methylated-DNA-protein-cysteine methyltransferase-like protein